MSVHAAGSTPRFSPPFGTPPRAAVSPGALPVGAVLNHAARLAMDAADARQRTIAAVGACARLIAARQRLTLALDGQQRIEQLMQLADGRERARRLRPDEREALQPHLKAVWARAAQALGEWRDAGQHFTGVTHLLPTQLSHAVAQAPALTAQAWQALMQAQVREAGGGPSDEVDVALCRYMAAHRRCEEAQARARAARAARGQAESGWRMGRGSLSGVAGACLAELASVDTWLAAEARRAAARGALCALAGGLVWQLPLER
ncbi:hypothetical protein [Hydrogenophaga borbori]|uniref:hypothetical protein n=1 Tax=Hydrogenophaga borbori TaxID=2294117 RepID=UPI00301DA2A8